MTGASHHRSVPLLLTPSPSSADCRTGMADSPADSISVRIDVLQLEYTPLGQYAGQFRQIPSILFEHDIYFQSIARQLPGMKALTARLSATFEYLRAFRYELRLLPTVDRVQVCSAENHSHIVSLLPQLQGKVDDGLRAGIDTARYAFKTDGREPDTMLFLGSFRHLPNQEGLEWFTRRVLPLIVAKRPNAKLMVVGSDPPPRHTLPGNSDAIELVGFVEDVLEPVRRYSLFVCPILSGSGVRVKLLEAFAAGMPVVSTRIGAEGLASVDGEICALADDPQLFADRVVTLLTDAAALAPWQSAPVLRLWINATCGSSQDVWSRTTGRLFASNVNSVLTLRSSSRRPTIRSAFSSSDFERESFGTE